MGTSSDGAEILCDESRKGYTKGTIISTLFAIVVSGGCYFLGGFGRLFSDQINVETDGFDSIIPTMLSTLPDILIGLVVLLVLSASMSTLSSLVIASSSTLTLDFLKDNFIKNMSEKTQVLIIRALIILFILISVVIAIIQYKNNITFIAQLMGVSWVLWPVRSWLRSSTGSTGKRRQKLPAGAVIYGVPVS